ncbi:TetR family transcriptional regulator [Bacillus piscicola]|uniref:TetR family transcriptional regulator n=1 Tax=Bacillus piscicola TaxID=1632684 RepID=UPI001F090F9B|nr:TetR family transcriptional regulator [Bacillus piscicola]
MNKLKTESTYKALLDAAVVVMQEKGFEKASVSAITKQAGVAHGTFYTYFTAKNEVIPALAENIVQETLNKMKQRTEPHTEPAKLMQDLIDVTFEMTEIYKDVITFCYAGLAFYNSFDRWEAIYAPYYQWLEEHLEGDYHNNDKMILIPMIVDVIENAADRYYIAGNKKINQTQLKQAIFEVVMRMLPH